MVPEIPQFGDLEIPQIPKGATSGPSCWTVMKRKNFSYQKVDWDSVLSSGNNLQDNEKSEDFSVYWLGWKGNLCLLIFLLFQNFHPKSTAADLGSFKRHSGILVMVPSLSQQDIYSQTASLVRRVDVLVISACWISWQKKIELVTQAFLWVFLRPKLEK
jgi:hypothetical protein